MSDTVVQIQSQISPIRPSTTSFFHSCLIPTALRVRNARFCNNQVKGDTHKLARTGAQRCASMWLRICTCQPLSLSNQPFTIPTHCPSSHGFAYLILDHVLPWHWLSSTSLPRASLSCKPTMNICN